MTLWEVDIHPAEGYPDQAAARVLDDARDLGIPAMELRAAHGYLLQGTLDEAEVKSIAASLLADPIVERSIVSPPGELGIGHPDGEFTRLIQVLFKPGVMDPVAQSAQSAIHELGWQVDAVATLRKYWVGSVDENALNRLATKLLANDSIEQVVIGPLAIQSLQPQSNYTFELGVVPLLNASHSELEEISREKQLYLTVVEMETIQRFFGEMGRDPTDVELETVAQTWSEHCSHKTLAGRIAYRDERGEQYFDNMLKETIFAATVEIRERLGVDDWCVSVFKDNAGVVKFDDETHAVFKVETHNHPSALEPYGGANTGMGGVIRDTLGTGLGAKPVCNTDIFCFAPPDTDPKSLPPGVLHPRRVMQGVISGVRDYGNRMGIPTVNGAVYFDPRYLGNPLVYCGNVGILPKGAEIKAPKPGDLIVTLGGRTGRDGIHGATFSSAELTSDSEMMAGGAVQIGNAITEKMLLDVLLQARDLGLYNAVTDCGAGGYSSAVGEMGEPIGAEVWLDQVPLKYAGLSYTEIWISEAQERMVLAVPPENWDALRQLSESEGVEATIIGEFKPTGNLLLKYESHEVANLPMSFLHDGRPPVIREAKFHPTPAQPFQIHNQNELTKALHEILSSLNVCSKEWVIRQYDHEVQGSSVIKPLVGIAEDGPGDAAVIRPKLNSNRGLVISCGMNPHFGDLDPYHMAASAIDEALRNCIAVGADPQRIAILDNFCWGDTDRSEVLGALVRAAIGCYDTAIAFGTPFISGKDSLNNEFHFENESGKQESIAIPSSLLISALGQVSDVHQCVTMDLKSAGNHVYLVGKTRQELGGSHLGLVRHGTGGAIPQVFADEAIAIFRAIHQAIQGSTVRACHDLSEGGLAVAAAEMAFSGGLGMQLWLEPIPLEVNQIDDTDRAISALFSESNSRFLCEVEPESSEEFQRIMNGVTCARIGTVTDDGELVIADRADLASRSWIKASIKSLKEAWQKPLRWS